MSDVPLPFVTTLTERYFLFRFFEKDTRMLRQRQRSWWNLLQVARCTEHGNKLTRCCYRLLFCATSNCSKKSFAYGSNSLVFKNYQHRISNWCLKCNTKRSLTKKQQVLLYTNTLFYSICIIGISDCRIY